ncbi:MAG: 30S ribosome-binding factor RbfA [Sphingobacteriales bacterium]|nr:30S ribosome-binding factor RbfA [Sphingobacteriales bacterium]
MTNRRLDKFSRLMLKELGYIFLNEGKKLFGNAMIGVTRAIVSPDLGYVKVYINFLNVEDKEKMIETVRENTKELRMMLAHRIRNEVRRVPELAFFYDDSLDYAEKMDEIFKKLNQSEDKKEE